MLIFLYGKDVYRSRKKLQEIVEYYKKVRKSGLNLKVFDFKDADFQDFKNAVCSASMFNEKKLIILKNAFLNFNFQERFLKEKHRYLESKDVFLFYSAQEIPQNNALFRFLKQKARVQEFKPLNTKQLKDWIIQEFRSYKTNITPEALEQLVKFVGNDLWQMSNEIRKLVGFKKKDKTTKQDVELLIRPKIDIDIFRTIDAIASKNNSKALEFIHKHIARGDSPLYLLSMIGYQFRNLLTIKKHCPPAEMHPYVLKKGMNLAKRFSLEELKKIYLKIFQTDLDIKTGRIEAESALDILITEI